MSNGMNIREKLAAIQQEFKAPKVEYNSHGHFNYRKLESMESVLKPLLKKYDCYTKYSDKLEEAGGRPHITATAYLVDIATGDTESASATVQEAEIQKGMQQAQISGSSSSYARKYALSGLLAVDDGENVDNKAGDLTDWDAEIKTAKTLEQLMKIFGKMDALDKKNYTEALSSRKTELANANN